MTELAHGAWNPSFCASDATYEVRQFCREMREYIDNLENFAQRTEGRSSFWAMTDD